MPETRLLQAETWIFDLDNTLYPPACGVLAAVQRRVGEFVASALRLDQAEATRVQKSYLERYGATLRGLMLEHGVDPAAYADVVYDIDLSQIIPDSRLQEALARLPGRRIIFTNACRAHAHRVLDRLDVDPGLFDGVFDIAASGYLPKPAPDAYRTLLDRFGVDAGAAIMVDDQPRNLATAASLGLATVLVHDGRPVAPDVLAEFRHVTQDLPGWLAAVVADGAGTAA